VTPWALMAEGALALSFNASIASESDRLQAEKEEGRKVLDIAVLKRQRDEGAKRHAKYLERMKERRG
jgi:hypothetical protein